MISRSGTKCLHVFYSAGFTLVFMVLWFRGHLIQPIGATFSIPFSPHTKNNRDCLLSEDIDEEEEPENGGGTVSLPSFASVLDLGKF